MTYSSASWRFTALPIVWLLCSACSDATATATVAAATIATATTATATTATATAAVDRASAPLSERLQEFAARFESERATLGIPGAAVALLRHGKLVFAGGFGTKGVDSNEPIDAETLFRIGSMTKVVTAIGVMSAVDDGLLDLDEPLQAAIPDLALPLPEANDLTLRLLLSQQSGLRDYLEIDASTEDSALATFAADPTLGERVDFVNPPGLFWNYSNPNYYLAGRALEAQGGVSYRHAVAERVFAPLGMSRSYFLPSDVIADGNYTAGFGVNDLLGEGLPESLSPTAYDNAWARPAGYAFSNVLDWARLMQFLMQGDPAVVSEESHAELIAPQLSTHTLYADVKTTALGLGDDYGLGVGLGAGFYLDRRQHPEQYVPASFIGHGGDIPGFASTFLAIPETGFAMVVLSNRDALRPTESIQFALQSFADLPAPAAPPPEHTVDPKRFAQYAGQYQARDGGTVSVTFDGAQLKLSGSALDATGLSFEPVLEPTTLDNFELWVTLGGERFPLEVTFLEGDGGYEWFRSRIAVAQRTDDLPLAVP
ncbi:MAG: hypothetical protein RL033_5829 [Pseudomonadota bacterium]|jgi:CubicO group peptidase (beta-lactamase class C family)